MAEEMGGKCLEGHSLSGGHFRRFLIDNYWASMGKVWPRYHLLWERSIPLKGDSSDPDLEISWGHKSGKCK